MKGDTWNPLVSIVIPVYNGSNFLSEAIDSALAQTYDNLEIIVINDGSKDDGETERIALSYGDKIRYFKKENGGTSTALNVGIENMRGEYFSWLSHDDLYYPSKISRAIEELSKIEDKNTIIISDVDGMNEDYTRTFSTALYQKHRDDYPKRNDHRLYPVVYNKTHGCTHLFSKKVFETVGMFDEKELVAHDFEFYFRAFAAFPHLYIDEALITARESSSRQGKKAHTLGNIEYSLLYIKILRSLTDEDILQMAPTLEGFVLDMEEFFSYADYSIALEYLEVFAESRGIKTRFGRREVTWFSVLSDTQTEPEAQHEPEQQAVHNNRLKRLVKALKKYGLIKTIKLVLLKIKSKLGNSKKTLTVGVNLLIHCLENSAGVQGRLLQQALESAEIPYNIIDLSKPDKSKLEVRDKQIYKVNLIACHVASDTLETIKQCDINLENHYNIGYMAWELAEIPEAYCKNLEIFQEIWTLSGFCTNSIEKKARCPVLTMPLYVDNNRTVIDNGLAYFNIKEDIFLFMVAYDCASFVSRKNPHAVVQAFMEAFTPDDHHVGLIVKLIYPENDKAHIDELLELLSPYKNIFLIDKYLTDEEMRSLLFISDAFVSLHRSEGLGLLPLEAMSLGTPVISTEWSGNMEYMNHMNAALVGYKMILVNGQYVGSVPGDDYLWAEPDVNEAAELMKQMVKDKKWRDSLIANGKYTADELYNVSSMSRGIRSRLEILGLF